MKTVPILILMALLAGIGAGCASNREASQAAAAQERRNAQIMEQVDRNAQLLRETSENVTAITERISKLETRVETAVTNQTADVQEIKENLSFMNDQIRRLDGSVQTRPPAPGAPPSAAEVFKPGGFDLEAAYKGALDEYYARRFEAAIAGFTEILTVAPTSSLGDNAQYWIGESYYSMGNFPKALESFRKVLDFPKSNKLADAQLKIALTYEKMGNTGSAREAYQTVIRQYPGTTAATLASQAVQRLGG